MDGLVLKRGGKEVRPLYLSKRDCDAAVAKLGDEKPQARAAGSRSSLRTCVRLVCRQRTRLGFVDKQNSLKPGHFLLASSVFVPHIPR